MGKCFLTFALSGQGFWVGCAVIEPTPVVRLSEVVMH